MVDRLFLRVAEVGGDVDVIGRKRLLHSVEAREAGVVVLGIVEGDGIEGGEVFIMILCLVIVDHLDAADGLDRVVQRGGLVQRDIRDHDLRRAVGDELFVHDVQRLLRLGILRQVVGEVALDLDPVAREGREDQQDDGDEEDEAAFINDEGRHLLHKGSAGAFGSLIHRKILLSRLGCAWGQSSTSS